MTRATEPETSAVEGLLPGIAEKIEKARAARLPAPGFDAEGNLLPESDEERARRSESLRQLFEEWQRRFDDDPPGAYEEALRIIDAERPHRKLFEGYY
jgi:hypothetical protein